MLTLLLGLALAVDPAPSTESPAMQASDLSWLAGTWVQSKDGSRTEETWLPPEGDALFGISRTTKDGTTRFHEYLRIEERDGTLVYVALPKGAKAEVGFPATTVSETVAVFEKPDHDFPTKIAYALEGKALHVEVRGPDGKGFALDFERVD